MIKLNLREMKSLSRILSVVLCFVPFACAGAAGTVATTAGSNLTAFNPSNANNNQWASMSNGRYDAANAPSAKADFGNCNSLILRCAQPKCSNGGCAEAGIAAAIVKGCVQSNKSCAQYGDDLVQYMSAQLVASSNAKINEQNLAVAAAAQQQSEQQMQQMQYQMQQMQAQMAQQQAESAQQLQEALAQQAAQNQAALEEMKNAATEAAKETEAGISAYQQDAINRGVSEDILTRQTIAGQIMTEIENAETSLKEVKVAMNNAFEYAKCDARGNGCSGPKRVKKWRELAHEFSDPYNNTIDKIYDALMIAQTVGVDLSQIYMMLNNSCNQWGQYLCPQMNDSQIIYPSTEEGQKGTPQVCNGSEAKNCQPCTLIKVLTESKDDQEAVYVGWVDAASSTTNGNTTVVACASSALESAKLFARRTRTKNGANLVDMDMLELWLDQIGPDKKYDYGVEPERYCSVSSMESMKDKLRKSTLSKSVDVGEMYCDMRNGVCNTVTAGGANASYINPVYAICDAHQYNAGVSNSANLTSDKIAETKEIVGLKTTVVSQQMYKQYEYLNATLRRLKTQLEKAALTTTLQAAGAKSEGGPSSSGLLGGNHSKNSQYENCSGKDIQEAIYCLRQNYSALATQINNKKCNASIKKQLATDLKIIDGKIPTTTSGVGYTKIDEKCKDQNQINCSDCLEAYSNGLNTLDDVRLDREARRQGRYRD